MSNMVRIEGPQLEALKTALTERPVYLLRISWGGDHITYKTNEGGWTPPVGAKQEPY